MKENCRLQNGLNSDYLDMLELIRGVHSDVLRRKNAQGKDPKPNKLIKIAREFVHGIEIERNFKAVSSAWGAKAKDSDYKKDRAKLHQQKAQDLAAARAASPNAKNSGKDTKAAYWGCGRL